MLLIKLQKIMKNMRCQALWFTAALFGFINPLNAQTRWELDKAHTNIRFSATHMVLSDVEGEFKEFDGSVVSHSDDFDGATVEFAAKTASVDTDNERRDEHLRSDDFFNAAEFPELTFKGNIEKAGDKYYLVGDLTIRNYTQRVNFDVQYNGSISLQSGRKAGFKVTGSINRFVYGMRFDRVIESGGLVVGENINIPCNVEIDEVQEAT